MQGVNAEIPEASHTYLCDSSCASGMLLRCWIATPDRPCKLDSAGSETSGEIPGGHLSESGRYIHQISLSSFTNKQGSGGVTPQKASAGELILSELPRDAG